MTSGSTQLGMPGRIVRVMLGCPGDLQGEVPVFFEEVRRFNEQHAEEYGVALLPKHWSTHAHPRLGGRAQGVINEQLASKADVLIALFWTRLGTDTGVAASGTVEEIFEFYNSGRPVKLYFSDSATLSPEVATDPKFVEEYQRLMTFKKEAQQLGLYGSFKSTDDFREQLRWNLLQEIRTLRDQGFLPRERAARQEVLETLPTPPESLKTLKRTVDRLRIDWKSEAESHMSPYNRGKQIMARLSGALSSHLSELSDHYTVEQLAPIEDLLKPVKEIEQAHPVMGPEFHEWFWRTGTQTFADLLSAINALLQPQRTL